MRAAPAVYAAAVVSDYTRCLFDPHGTNFMFNLLHPVDGIPLVNANGTATKATVVIENLLQYRFEPAPELPGLFDITLDGLYLGINLNGDAIFTTARSGPRYVMVGGQTYVTSLFSYDCKGHLHTGIPGIVSVELWFEDGKLVGQPVVAEYYPNSNITKRHIDSVTHRALARAQPRKAPGTPGAFNPYVAPGTPGAFKLYRPYVAPATPGAFSPYVTPPNSFVPIVPDPHPRCSAGGAIAYPKLNARKAYADGCGPGFHHVADLVYGECCNRHDLCYDNCTATFDQCNFEFSQCNKAVCEKLYDNNPLEVATLLWGCKLLGEIYVELTQGPFGLEAFRDSTGDRCDCKCAPGKKLCDNKCVDQWNNPDHCSACGDYCKSHICHFDHCDII